MSEKVTESAYKVAEPAKHVVRKADLAPKQAVKRKGSALKEFDTYVCTITGYYTVAIPDDRDRLMIKPFRCQFLATPRILDAGVLFVFKNKRAEKLLKALDGAFSAIHLMFVESVVPFDKDTKKPLTDQGEIDEVIFRIGNPDLMNEAQMRRYVEIEDFDMDHNLYKDASELGTAIKLYKEDYTGYKVNESFILHKASKTADVDADLRELELEFEGALAGTMNPKSVL